MNRKGNNIGKVCQAGLVYECCDRLLCLEIVNNFEEAH